jgi:hypothetical protein
LGTEENVVFTQRNSEVGRHRDGFRFTNGQEILLQRLAERQRATVLSLSSALIARLGGSPDAVKVTRTDEFELKKRICDLFEELERFQDGTVTRLEFRHGLPFLFETHANCCSSPEPHRAGEQTQR